MTNKHEHHHKQSCAEIAFHAQCRRGSDQVKCLHDCCIQAVQLQELLSQRGTSRRSLEAASQPPMPQQARGMPQQLSAAAPGVGQYMLSSHRTVSAPNVMQYTPEEDAHIPATSRRAVGMPFIHMPPDVRSAARSSLRSRSQQGQQRAQQAAGRAQGSGELQHQAGSAGEDQGAEEPLLWRGDRPLLVHEPAQVSACQPKEQFLDLCLACLPACLIDALPGAAMHKHAPRSLYSCSELPALLPQRHAGALLVFMAILRTPAEQVHDVGPPQTLDPKP